MENAEGDVGEHDAADTRTQVARVLRDLGDPEPPLDLGSVIAQLKLDFKYYNSTDLPLFDEFAHRERAAGKLVMREPGPPRRYPQGKLNALWLPDGRRILMDEDVPTPKRRHVSAHEIHIIVPLPQHPDDHPPVHVAP